MIKSTEYFKDVLSKSPLKTSWLWFFVLIRLPLGIVFSLLSFISSLGNMKIMTDPPDINTALFIILIQLCLVTLYIVTYIQMKRLTARGYNLCITTIVMECLSFTLFSASPYPDSGNSDYIIIRLLTSFFVWFLPNYIYFKKRRKLFEPYVLALIEEYDRNLNNNESVPHNSSEVINADPKRENSVYQPYWHKDDTASQTAQPDKSIQSFQTQPDQTEQPPQTVQPEIHQELPAAAEGIPIGNIDTHLVGEEDIKREFQMQNRADYNACTSSLREAKVRYCKYCGHQIDSSTNICTGCKKQYFKLKPVHIITAMAVVIFIMFIYIIILHGQIAELVT